MTWGSADVTSTTRPGSGPSGNVITEPRPGPERWGRAPAGDRELNAYIATTLRQLGYTVKLREVSPTLDPGLLRALRHVQITSAPGWIADYPAGSNFYDAVFSCKTAMAGAG